LGIFIFFLAFRALELRLRLGGVIFESKDSENPLIYQKERLAEGNKA
jgi:hypothetical protein